jgi:single-strand DNA-binding protein
MITLPAVTVVGTLVADPEIKHLQSGVAVANFRVASNDRKRDESGAWVDGDATFLRCTVWRDFAEHAADSLRKGHRVVVVGQLRERSWETDAGEKRTAYELDVEEVAPSLRFATAVVTKVSRNGNGGNRAVPSKGSGWRSSGGAADDPWGSAPAAPSDPEPPF